MFNRTEEEKNKLTDESVEILMKKFDLTKQQAQSQAVGKIIMGSMDKDTKFLIDEAYRKVEIACAKIDELKQIQAKAFENISKISKTLTAVLSAEEKYGDVMKDDSKDLIATFACLLDMCLSKNVSPTAAVDDISYILYAKLGGQAKREIVYPETSKHQEYEQPFAGRRL